MRQGDLGRTGGGDGGDGPPPLPPSVPPPLLSCAPGFVTPAAIGTALDITPVQTKVCTKSGAWRCHYAYNFACRRHHSVPSPGLH